MNCYSEIRVFKNLKRTCSVGSQETLYSFQTWWT